MVEAAVREQGALAEQFLGQQRHLREFGRTQPRRARVSDREHGSRGDLVGMPEQATHVRGQRLQSRGLALHHVRVELRRAAHGLAGVVRSEEHTSELQSLMRISYAVFCLKKKKNKRKI